MPRNPRHTARGHRARRACDLRTGLGSGTRCSRIGKRSHVFKRLIVAHLKLEAEIPHNVSFEPDQQIEFRFTSPPPVVVILKERNRPDRNENFRRCNAVCTAIALPDIQPELKVELDASLEDGIVKLSKLKPKTIKSVDEILHHMRAVSRSTLIMFNWTHGLDGPP